MRFRLSIPALLLLAGCSAGGGAPDTRPIQNDVGGPIVETVNGTPVPRALLEAVARARDLDLSSREQRDQAMALLTDYVLLAQAAQQNGFFAKPDFRADVEAARLQGVGNATLGKMQAQAPITDAVVKAEFDAQVARIGKVEYDFSQLLFDNADDALKATGEVISGKPFSEVYKAWRRKAKQAKAFTRVRSDQLPEELAKALGELKNGETTKVPVKTRFGWHIVHLDIVNPFTPPPFEQVKESVRESLLRRVGQERLRQLKEQAKIEYAPGVTPPAPRSDGDRAAQSDAKDVDAGPGKP
jgi:peptidyl-prolyl cis-trans isomerase C